MVNKGDIIQGSEDKQWIVSHKIGAGKCCEVFVAQLKDHEDEKVAVKVYKQGEQYEGACQREKSLLHILQEHHHHLHIVEVKDHGVYKEQHFLIQELFNCDLHQILLKCQEDGFSIKLIQHLSKDIFLSLHHLHHVGFVHGDLKPANLMWSSQHGCLKLIDFGLSFLQGDIDVEKVQSPGFQAPEVKTWNSGAPCRKQLTTKCDMWSVGCLLFWMLTGQKLPDLKISNSLCDSCNITNRPETCQYEIAVLKLIKSLDKDRALTEDLQDLIVRLIQCDPFSRPKCKEALNHHFFTVSFEDSFRDFLVLPTCILRLVNMLDEVDLQSEEVIKDLEQDIRIECEKFGKVLHVVIPWDGHGREKVYVQYQHSWEAEDAFEKLNGRIFNDRTVITTFFCPKKFRHKLFH